MTRRLAFRIGIITLAIVPLYYLAERIDIVTTPSIEYSLLWKSDEPAQRLDYVLFDLQHPLIGASSIEVSKQLRCVTGDELRVTGLDYYCNNEFLGTAKTKTLDGRPMPQFVFNGRIPEGKGFAYGTHPDSFDSRYWGFVSTDATRRLIGLL